MPDGKSIPVILFNGNVLSNAAALQELFEFQMPSAHYEVQSFDCHVLNPNFAPAGTAATDGASAQNMTLTIIVSGYVKFGPVKESEMRGFSDTFVLVPKPEAFGSKSRTTNLRGWFIQSQNFRLVV